MAGRDYPGSVGELLAWFASDADCRDYLEWLRWPEGFVCSKCTFAGGWRLGDGRWMCAGCGHRTSVTAGTIFDRTRTPLTVWFHACWEFASAKDGVSALSLQRTLQIGSYQTAWAMLHRLRQVLVRPGREWIGILGMLLCHPGCRIPARLVRKTDFAGTWLTNILPRVATVPARIR